MNNLIIKTTHFCGRCKQVLLVGAFYFSKRKNGPDGYCKECRKIISHERHAISRCMQIVENERSYPVITEIKDDKQRNALILHALQVVLESQSRRKRKRWEEEDREITI